MNLYNLFQQSMSESLEDDFAAILRAKGYSGKSRTWAELKADREAQLAQRQAAANAPVPKPSAEQVAAAKQKLAQLELGFDKNYQYSDDHSVWSQNHSIDKQMQELKRLIARGESDVDEGVLGFMTNKKPPVKPVPRDAYADRLEIARRQKGIQNPYFQVLLNKFNSGGRLTDFEKRDLGLWLASQPGNFRAKQALSPYTESVSEAATDGVKVVTGKSPYVAKQITALKKMGYSVEKTHRHPNGDVTVRLVPKVSEAANAAQQAAIAINMKKHHQKPKSEGVAEAATDDPKFQKMMGAIQKTTPDPVSGYVAVSYASEKPSKKISGATVNGRALPATTDDPGQLLKDLKYLKFTPDRIEQQLTVIGQKYGWDLVEPAQGQGYTDVYFDTNKEFTTHNQKQLAAMIVKTVAAINKYFSEMNRSLQATGLPGYQTNVWQGMGANGNINQIEDLNQITNIAQGKDAKADPGPAIGQMILKYIPEYEAENDELGYDSKDFANAKKVASIYIAKGERAGLEAQGKLESHVSEMIDELLSDHGGSSLRTIWELDKGVAEGSLNEFSMGDDGEDPTDNYPCYDCGSTIFLHHTKLCDLAEDNAIRDLPAKPGSQHWTGQIPKGLHPIPGLQEGQGVAEGNGMFGDQEVSWEKGGRRAPTGAFRNPAVVKTNKPIGARVSDIGPGGKEYNVKTDKEWDKQKGVAEGSLKESVIRSETIGPYTHELHKTPWGYQVRVYAGGKQVHSDITKPTEEKGQKSFDSNIAYTKKQLRINEQGVAEDQATRTCPQCDGSGEDTLDPTKSCRRCSGKGYIPMPKEQGVAEEWSQKYKSSINCSHPKGFSQKAHCAGKKKHEESMMTMEAVCPDCGMCQTHGNLNEIKKGAKDSNGFTKCWPGHHAAGTKKGKNGGQVRNCVPNEGRHDDEGGYYANDNERDQQRQMDYNRSTRYGTGGPAGDEMDKESWYIVRDGKMYVANIWPNQRQQAIAQGYSSNKEQAMKVGGLKEDHSDVGKGWGQGAAATAHGTSKWAGAGHDDSVHENPEWYNDEANGMTSSQLKSLVKHASKLRHAVKQMQAQGDTLEPWQQSKVTKAADYLDAVFNAVDDEHDMGEEQDAYLESLSSKLAEKLKPNDPVKKYIDDFAKAAQTPNAKGHHQFKNKSPEKIRQMAIAASYGAKNPKKKKK